LRQKLASLEGWPVLWDFNCKELFIKNLKIGWYSGRASFLRVRFREVSMHWTPKLQVAFS
jgi:hypothetical protein